MAKKIEEMKLKQTHRLFILRKTTSNVFTWDEVSELDLGSQKEPKNEEIYRICFIPKEFDESMISRILGVHRW